MIRNKVKLNIWITLKGHLWIINASLVQLFHLPFLCYSLEINNRYLMLGCAHTHTSLNLQLKIYQGYKGHEIHKKVYYDVTPKEIALSNI